MRRSPGQVGGSCSQQQVYAMISGRNPHEAWHATAAIFISTRFQARLPAIAQDTTRQSACTDCAPASWPSSRAMDLLRRSCIKEFARGATERALSRSELGSPAEDHALFSQLGTSCRQEGRFASTCTKPSSTSTGERHHVLNSACPRPTQYCRNHCPILSPAMTYLGPPAGH